MHSYLYLWLGRLCLKSKLQFLALISAAKPMRLHRQRNKGDVLALVPIINVYILFINIYLYYLLEQVK